MPKTKLSISMTITEFENGYWYTNELKDFAQTIGIPSANKLRKDELEKAIQFFLKTGNAGNVVKRKLSQTGIKDTEKGLRLSLPVINYINNKETKAFIEKEARKIVPGLKKRSGSSYRLNRWREEKLTSGARITYKDVVDEYVRLNQLTEAFEKIPQVRYINFLSEFLKKEKNATQAQAIKAWKEVKKLDMPNTYDAWKKRS
jgi:hypothetical protein